MIFLKFFVAGQRVLYFPVLLQHTHLNHIAFLGGKKIQSP